MSTTVLIRRRLRAVPSQAQPEPDTRTDMERIRERLEALLRVLDQAPKLPEAARRARARAAVSRLSAEVRLNTRAGDGAEKEVVHLVLAGASGYPLEEMRCTLGNLALAVNEWAARPAAVARPAAFTLIEGGAR